MAHEDYKDMLAAQALNALEAAEMRDLEAHLQSCAECRLQLSSWEDTVAGLAFAALEARPLEPSSQLRGRILQVIHADVRALDRTKEVADGADSPGSNVLRLQQRGPRTWTSAQIWSAIAAGLVFVALGASLFVLWNQNRAARQELARLSEQVRESQQQLAQQRDAVEILASPGARMMELSGTSEMPSANAMLAYDKDGRAILMAKGLPPPPEGKAYQLWFIAGGRPLPGRVFATDKAGTGMLTDHVPTEALNAAVFAITLEPKSGVQAPTGAIFLKSGS
jgi:uncharacterized protein YjiS (DUF1127 family)